MANYKLHQIMQLYIQNENLFLNFTVVQIVFRNNEKCPSFDN